MADNYDKLWLQDTLHRNARLRALEAIQTLGKALPCVVVGRNGSIVTVAFEVDAAPWTLPNITIPKLESPYMRSPTQVGDKGMTIPADAYLGGISGLGGGTASLTQRGNLSTLVFIPVSNAGNPPSDPDAVINEAPNGVINKTLTGSSSCVTNQNGTTVTFGTTVLEVNATGIIMTVGSYVVEVTSSGLTINGQSFVAHEHSGVTSGSSNTGGVV
ncbi:MAG: hypothetical protein KGI54_18755 [Pseudomonadota bacterium]|nr:hypothetical protein [Pseudomonadota bacterium]